MDAGKNKSFIWRIEYPLKLFRDFQIFNFVHLIRARVAAMLVYDHVKTN